MDQAVGCRVQPALVAGIEGRSISGVEPGPVQVSGRYFDYAPYMSAILLQYLSTTPAPGPRFLGPRKAGRFPYDHIDHDADGVSRIASTVHQLEQFFASRSILS